jgi:FlaA1/EpsC-like NDP-sugar epimerase
MTDKNKLENKIILVTGGTGSIGEELVKQILELKPKQLRILSRDENKQYHLLEKLNYPKNIRLLIGDIRDKERLFHATENVDIIFHAAALKHVPLCEYNPFEAVKTNIIGTQNIIEAALQNKIKKVVAISTDKAANPVNIMGTSKLMMEKILINANYYIGNRETSFSCVRFGNVAWSSGSVLPLWKKQIDNNSSIKVTNDKMTRFFMSKIQAAKLVLKASELSNRGEIFILKMPSIEIIDLAKIFISKYYPNQKIKIEIIGNRIGEKKDEELFDKSDLQKTIFENEEMFIVSPDFNIYAQLAKSELYPEKTFNYPKFKKSIPKNIKKFSSSKNCINKEKIRDIV